MSGIEEAALMSALVYGGLGAEGGVGAAAGAATAAGALGTGAAAGAGAGGLLGAASYGGASLAEQTAMQEAIAAQQAMDAGGTAVAQGTSYGGGSAAEQAAMNQALSGGQTATSSLLQPGSAESSIFGNIPEGQLPPSQLTDFEKFMRFGKQGLSTIGKNLAKTGMTGTIAKSLLGDQAPPKQESIMARQPGGGAPSQQPSSVSLLGQQPHQVTPYAPTLAGVGGDDAEMQRRRKLMLQQMGYA
jgi:type IV secretion system protein TrbL